MTASDIRIGRKVIFMIELYLICFDIFFMRNLFMQEPIDWIIMVGFFYMT